MSNPGGFRKQLKLFFKDLSKDEIKNMKNTGRDPLEHIDLIL
jgi:hypothetical protein